MPREPVEKLIGEHNYRVRPMPPSKVISSSKVLAKMLLPTIAKVAEKAQGGDDVLDQEVGLRHLGDAASLLVQSLDDPKLDELIKELARYSEVEVSPDKWPQLSVVFEDHFLGRTGEMMEWIVFAVTTQFSDFFEGLFARLAR